METCCSILAWRILMDKGTWWATVHGVTESDTTELIYHTHENSWPPHPLPSPRPCLCRWISPLAHVLLEPPLLHLLWSSACSPVCVTVSRPQSGEGMMSHGI